MFSESVPARASPLILKTTLRHLAFVTGFLSILVIGPLGLEVAVVYLQKHTSDVLYHQSFNFI